MGKLKLDTATKAKLWDYLCKAYANGDTIQDEYDLHAFAEETLEDKLGISVVKEEECGGCCGHCAD